MRKILLSVLALFFSHTIFAQLVTFNFAEKSNSTSTQSNFDADGVQPSVLSFGNVERSISGTVATFSKFNKDATITPSSSGYLQFTITPDENFKLTILTITLRNVNRTGDGPKKLVVRTSKDNYATNSSNIYPVSTGTDLAAVLTLNADIAKDITAPITFRIYGYDGSNSGANSRLLIGGDGDDIEIDGIDPTTLPVRFGNVKATRKDKSVGISFSNYTEEEVVTYHVERSTNGYQFQSIGTIAPKANNNSRADYLFNDAAPAAGDNYYRIRAVETTGKQVYSSVVKVGVNGAAASLVLYPNPASKASGINLQLANLPAGVYSIRLYNGNGQVIATKQLQHTGGSLSEALPLQGAGAGRYIVEVKGAVQFTQSFLLQ